MNYVCMCVEGVGEGVGGWWKRVLEKMFWDPPGHPLAMALYWPHSVSQKLYFCMNSWLIFNLHLISYVFTSDCDFRYSLFSSENVITHDPGKGQESFKWNKRSQDISGEQYLFHDGNNSTVNRSPCTSFFVEPVEWMASLLIGTLDGKVLVTSNSFLFLDCVVNG